MLKLKIKRLIGKIKYRFYTIVSSVFRVIAVKTTEISKVSYQKAFDVKCKVGKKHVKANKNGK